jgi:hypothetical protein
LAAFGLTRADVAADEQVEVWPDNWDAVSVFTSMRTQWRTSFAGAVGLDYGVLPTIFSLHNIKRPRRKDIFDDLRILEDAALEAMREAK